MYIMMPTDTYKISKVFLPLKDSNGVDVATSLYSVTDPRTLSGTVEQAFEFSSTDDLEVGDSILIGSTTSPFVMNTIVSAGNGRYKTSLKIQENLNTTIIIKENFSVFKTIALEEGLYKFNNHEALIVSVSFSNVRISFDGLKARYDELSSTVDIKAKNDEAIKSVLAEFSYKPDFFRYLDMNQIRELIVLKMIMWLTKGTDLYEDSKQDYIDHKTEISNIVKVKTGETIENPEVIDEGAEPYSFKWTPRA